MRVNINRLDFETEMTTQRAAAIFCGCLFMSDAFCFLDDPEENKVQWDFYENNELNGSKKRVKVEFWRRQYKISA